MIGISSFQELIQIKSNGKYELLSDIDCCNKKVKYLIDDFKGELNGNGHCIKNLVVSKSIQRDEECCSLFMTMENACIRDICLQNIRFDIKNKNGYVLYNSILVSDAISTQFININIIDSFRIPLVYFSNTNYFENIKTKDELYLVGNNNIIK